MVQRHLSPVDIHQMLLLHFPQLPHHGTAVGGDIVRQSTEGKGQMKAAAVVAAGLKAEVAQQFLPNAAAAQDLHPLGEGGRPCRS